MPKKVQYVLDANSVVHVGATGVPSNYIAQVSPFRCGQVVDGTTQSANADGPTCIWCALGKPYHGAQSGTVYTTGATYLPSGGTTFSGPTGSIVYGSNSFKPRP